jgi:hypothetical protein
MRSEAAAARALANADLITPPNLELVESSLELMALEDTSEATRDLKGLGDVWG